MAKKGRILKHDVSHASATGVSANIDESPGESSGESPDESFTMSNAMGEANNMSRSKVNNTASEASYTEKVRGIRAAMAKQMVASVNTIPHFTVSDEIRMDKLIALRQSLKPMFEAKGIKLSFMPFCKSIVVGVKRISHH